MAADPLTRLRSLDSVSLTVRRLNEYTTWRPRSEGVRGYFWMVGWGPFILAWQHRNTAAHADMFDGEPEEAMG